MEEEKEAWYYSGLSYYKQSKYIEAELSCREALELDNYYASACLCLGAALFKQNKFSQSEEVIKNLLKLDESNKDAWRVLSIILQKQCKFKEAELANKKAEECK